MDMAVTGALRHRKIDRSLWLRRGQRAPVRVLRHHLAAGAAYLAASGVSAFDLRRPGTERAFLATASAAVRCAFASGGSAAGVGAGGVASSARHSAIPPVKPSLFETMVTSSGRSKAIFFALPPPRYR